MHTAALLLLFASTADWTDVMKAGNTALDAGQYRTAAQEFRKALGAARADAERAATLNNLAAVEETLGNLPQAERHYEQCIAIWSGSPNAPSDALAKPLNNLALLYGKRGEYSRAAELYRRSLELRPDDESRARVLNNLGRLSFVQKRLAEAEGYYLQALRIRPDDFAALSNLAELQVAQGRPDAAVRMAERVLAAEFDRPLEISGRLTLAAASSSSRNWAEAEKNLTRAIAVAHRVFGEHHAVTALVYAEYAVVVRKLKRKREAAEYEERARRAAGGTPDRHTVSVAELIGDQRR
jgi:tetratricopeptide (TPR) repeat protein